MTVALILIAVWLVVFACVLVLCTAAKRDDQLAHGALARRIPSERPPERAGGTTQTAVEEPLHSAASGRTP